MLHQRKNIANLFRAFEMFRNKSDSNLKLLIVGHKKWWTHEMESVYNSMRFKEEVIFLGRMPVDELARITAAAMAVTYISYFEGFGVPIAEAMRCGVPVITSGVTSMPEVTGDAGLLIDPFNVESVCIAMVELNSNSTLQKSLSIKGIEQSKKYSWNLTSEKLWQSIARAVE
jgi:glycosyltransferase involved in cell wall biosynthesis